MTPHRIEALTFDSGSTGLDGRAGFGDASATIGLTSEAVPSCKGPRVRKILREAYRRAAAFLTLAAELGPMPAGPPYELDAARP